MDLIQQADGLPPEIAAKSAVTLLGAAHHWAGRAKRAEAELGPLRLRLRVYELACWGMIPAVIVPWVLLWMRG